MYMENTGIKYFGGLLTGLLLLVYGCSDWLDVNPRTEIKENDIYAGEAGFKNVMNGIYIQLASEELYGKNMSFYFPDLLAQLWVPKTGTTDKTESSAANFDFKNAEVEELIEDVWDKYYTCIAHVNNILENLDKTDVVFSVGNKELLYGEAYGLRAFIHLEVLRLFGPVPDDGNTGDATVAIPYVKELTKEPAHLISKTYGEVKEMILQDLDSAEVYLKNDPFTLGSMYDFNHPGNVLSDYVPEDEWHYYRQTHFNCYAVDAVRARFYHWIGDSEKARLYAKKVVEAVNPDGSKKFELTYEKDYSNSQSGSLVFHSEQVFAVNCSNHQDMITGIFTGTNPTLYTYSRYVNSIYENAPDDIRNKSGRYWTIEGSNAYFLKYVGGGGIDATNMIPLVRLSEMYLILIEDSPIVEAASFFETYRQSRGMSSTLTLTESNRLSRVESEYRKEFFGEGQVFYCYKKHNMGTITVPKRVTVPVGGYVVPKPYGQTSFE